MSPFSELPSETVSERHKARPICAYLIDLSVMAKSPRKPKDLTPRFGIGELYGYNLTQLSAAERQLLATENLKLKTLRSYFTQPG